MKKFKHINAHSVQEAASLLVKYGPKAKLIAGGSDLLPLMKERIITPEFLVNIKTIPEMGYIREEAQGLSIGALATLKDMETNPLIAQKFPFLAQATVGVASPQIRNMGTIGGNLCQRPWCWYFRGPLFQCLRKGGSTCFAASGENKYHAVIDGGPCYMVHPSDMAIAFIALEAKVKIAGNKGGKVIPMEEFFIGPKQNLFKENVLEPDEMVTEIHIPKPIPKAKGVYLKERERRSWDHATVGIAAIIVMEDGICSHARIVLSGVAPIPFRATASEEMLKEKKIDESIGLKAAEAAVSSAKPLNYNAYKVHMAKALIKKAILTVLG